MNLISTKSCHIREACLLNLKSKFSQITAYDNLLVYFELKTGLKTYFPLFVAHFPVVGCFKQRWKAVILKAFKL